MAEVEEVRDFNYWIALRQEADASFREIVKSPHMRGRMERLGPTALTSLQEWYIKGYLKGASKAAGG